MNFLFVDRIFNLDPGKASTAIKHVSASDKYLSTDEQGRTHLMSCIIGEALGQLCSWNIIKTSDFKLRLIGGVVGEVKMHDLAYVGDSIIMESTIERLDLDNQVVSFHGLARVGDKVILEVINGLGPLLPVAEFGDTNKVKQEFNHLYRPAEVPVIPEGKAIETSFNVDNRHINYDRIIEWHKGESVLAQKNVSLISPYLADHFPGRPVLPLSLLIESKLQLAYPFIKELTNKKNIQPTSVRRIKMNDFVEPGSIIYTRMKLKELKDDNIVLSFRTEMDGKRVCVCEAEFNLNGE